MVAYMVNYIFTYMVTYTRLHIRIYTYCIHTVAHTLLSSHTLYAVADARPTQWVRCSEQEMEAEVAGVKDASLKHTLQVGAPPAHFL